VGRICGTASRLRGSVLAVRLSETGGATRRPRVGLVLGAGGVVGASYLAGALEGIRRATGWSPADAELVVGTSAGAFIAAVIATGISPALMYTRCTGDVLHDASFSDELVALGARMDRHNEGPWLSRYRPPLRWPRPVLSSPRLLQAALRSRDKSQLVALATSLLGEGLFCTRRSIGGVVRTALPAGWPRSRLWVTACDLDAGERVVLGRDGRCRDLHEAVSAATAIPGVFAPVSIDGRRHCDAGIFSPSNLDLVAGEKLDAVLCLNPLTGAEPRARSGLVGRAVGGLGTLARRHFGELLAAERAEVERTGTRVFVLAPSAEDAARFPLNSMDLGSRPAIMRQAAASTAARLAVEPEGREIAALLRREGASSTVS
jgi:NTE family protein